jgi:site-specific DNA recombinase
LSNKDPNKTLHIYTRVSTTSQKEKGMSLTNQRGKGIEVSKKLGMEYVIWNEGGKSSFQDDLLNRPVMMDMMEGIKEGQVKHVYVTDFDRLSRKGTSWYIILRDFEKYDVTCYVSEGNKYDISNEYDKLMLTIVSGVSQFDNTQRTRRFQQNKIRKFVDGYYVHGTTVFGYEKKVVGKGKKLFEHPTNGKIVKKLYSLFSKGKTIKDLQDWLIGEKIYSPRNNRVWGQQQIINLLRNKHYIGETVFSDKRSGKVYKGKCKRLVNDKVWFEVQKRMSDLSGIVQQRRGQKHDYLLTSMLYCGECGYLCRGLKNERTYRNIYYCGSKEEKWRTPKYDVCDKKKSKSVNIDRLDEVVWNEFIGTIRDSHILKEMKKNSLMKQGKEEGVQLVKKQMREKKIEKSELQVELMKFQKKRHELFEWYMNGKVEEEERVKLEKVVEKNIWEVESKLEELDVFISRLHESKKWIDWFKMYMDDVKRWEKLDSIVKKKNILVSYVDKIYVGYDVDDELHKVEILLRLPLFNDTYKVNKRKGKLDKKRGYIVGDGTKNKTLYLQKTKVGRKKKPVPN